MARGHHRWTILAFVLAFLNAPQFAKSSDAMMIRVKVGGQWLEGQPLAWSSRSFHLLTRDGTLQQFKPSSVHDFQQTRQPFRSYTAGEMRARLLLEFGDQYEVTGTSHYLVVHPSRPRDLWANRFESLFRSFELYFGSRGLVSASPKFPLVAIVFSNRPAFVAHARRTGAKLPDSAIGYYSPRSNRILMYDQSASQSDHDWHHHAKTIIHEAAHQMAYNTGVHQRSAPPPRWCSEGLASMFEAQGVWDRRHHRDRSARINRPQLDRFQRSLTDRRPNSLSRFLMNDRAFFEDSECFYAESWALTFFLAETQPKNYTKYLQVTASRKPLSGYGPSERIEDFVEIFGRDLDLFEAHYLRFIQRLK